ncbi:adenosine receptor A2b-like [Oculina patagonica]
MTNLSNKVNMTQGLFCHEIPASILVDDSKMLITLIILNTFISIAATTGNLLVLVTIWRNPNLHSPSNTLLFGLALSDLCVGLVSEPLNIGFQVVLLKNSSEITSCTLMDTRTFISAFLTSVTLLNVTAMSVDRYLAIHLHLRYQQVVTESKTRTIIVCIWLISGLQSMIIFFDAITGFSVFTVTITVCLAIVTFVWIKTYQVVRHHQAQIQDQMNAATQSFNMARFRHSALNTMLVLVVFLVCYLPFLVAKISLTFNVTPSNVVFLEVAYVFVLLNSSLNPLLYFRRQRDLRAAANQTLIKFCCQTQVH